MRGSDVMQFVGPNSTEKEENMGGSQELTLITNEGCKCIHN